MPFSEDLRDWYVTQVQDLDPKAEIVSIDPSKSLITYGMAISSDESLTRPITDEELVRAAILVLLSSDELGYGADRFFIEKYYKHGHPSSKHDEVDLLVLDPDDLPYAMWELKSPTDFEAKSDEYIRYQLFGTAPLVGSPRLLVYATVEPVGLGIKPKLVAIDYTKYKSWEAWNSAGRPHATDFPARYTDPSYKPLTRGGSSDLRLDVTQAEFRAVAATFHEEFFSEHPDNTLFTNLVKCLLAKIYDERQTKNGEEYSFQVKFPSGKEESAAQVFSRINELYATAYERYIEPNTSDEISTKEFPPDRVKTVVKTIQGMSMTRGAALQGDVIGAFFEEILRAGFKQDKGMYFTHANLVHFILEAIDLQSLTVEVWTKATHPENRLPYIIDPACGSGSFLLKAMAMMTEAIRGRREDLVIDLDAEQFYSARMSDAMPNYWAEHFVYGIDPKFVMAITAKVNMVLHGDGSAHIFKADALQPLARYDDDRLRPAGEKTRSIERARYSPDLCEKFDVVVSNPPFGIKLASETKKAVPSTFDLRAASPSECFFLERWFQLLRPGGRLGVVVPESLLNATENVEARLFLYRCFWIRAIVSLPRNLFVDTPTLTSLLFAQKKNAEEIADWDTRWDEAKAKIEGRIDGLAAFLRKEKAEESRPASSVESEVSQQLVPLLDIRTRVFRQGGEVFDVTLPPSVGTGAGAANHYLGILKSAAFRSFVRSAVFADVVQSFDYEFPVYLVDEVGYKLSKRKERVRPNQLCRFVGRDSGTELPNLHIAAEEIDVSGDLANPTTILDFIRSGVEWG